MTTPRLYPAPKDCDVTSVECPQCDAWVGWACGQAHCDGYHRSRIKKAQAVLNKEEKDETKKS